MEITFLHVVLQFSYIDRCILWTVLHWWTTSFYRRKEKERNLSKSLRSFSWMRLNKFETQKEWIIYLQEVINSKICFIDSLSLPLSSWVTPRLSICIDSSKSKPSKKLLLIIVVCLETLHIILLIIFTLTESLETKTRISLGKPL